MLKVMILALVTVVTALPVLAAGPMIKLNVSLTPAGSFVAQSSSVRMGAVGKGDGRSPASASSGDQVFAKQVVLPLDSLSSGIALRDTHMKTKYFETAKYPNAILSNAVGKDGNFSGDLTIRNVTKKIEGNYEIAGNTFVGKFKTHLSDFNIAQANYMGVGVDDEVEVEVSLPGPGQK